MSETSNTKNKPLPVGEEDFPGFLSLQERKPAGNPVRAELSQALTPTLSHREREYFTLLSLEQSFDIDITLLEKNYFALQQQLHPDRFAGKSEQERTLSLQHSMTANEAYNTLKDPFKRGEYVLSLQGIRVKEGEANVKPSQAVLMAMMELREQLEEATTTEAIKNITAEVEKEKQLVLQNISACFAKQDYNQAAQEVIKLRYLDKAQEEIKLKRRAVVL